jgi:hypothetical protein
MGASSDMTVKRYYSATARECLRKVQEDLHLPNRKYILPRVFRPTQGNMAYRLKPEEARMVPAQGGG